MLPGGAKPSRGGGAASDFAHAKKKTTRLYPGQKKGRLVINDNQHNVVKSSPVIDICIVYT